MVINAPSLANLSLIDFGRDVDELVKGGVNFFHIDIMDGHYVPNLCFPVSVVKDLKKEYPDCTAEVHMMVDNPMDYIERLKEYGADYVSFHIDSTSFVLRTLDTIKKAGMKAGVVLNPSQRISMIEPFAHLLDYIIIMTVEPGFEGQIFLNGSLERLEELATFRKNYNLDFQIMVDGGVNYDIATDCVKKGADMLVTGIYVVFNQEDGISAACKRFRKHLEGVESEI